ncbi:MAG: bifunctional [glutamate--ammonia ligase]-adenylyl-L-tyrosine phosphorylase/[glutamate--ammonia-ligase] adenylyltransferase [Candidatus Binatia bacterium]
MKERHAILSGLSASQQDWLEQLIENSPSPSAARGNLVRLIEEAGTAPLEKLPESTLSALVHLLGGSPYLSDILIREGRKWPNLFLQQMTVSQKTVSEHLSKLYDLLKGELSLDSIARGLRQYKQREFLRIGARDLSLSASVEETMRELTSLAEASLEAAYRLCRAKLETEFGPPLIPGTERKNRFVILGMGKLGGEELNFSSDVDIIYLYEDERGGTRQGPKGSVGSRDFFSKLAEMITRMMGEVTEDGFVFRTDLRLRPLGRNGPLVQSVGSALLYYESWGQCWERAALIKARPVAGDRELGNQFIHDVTPFIYRRYLDFTTVEELREMKTRIERELVRPEKRERNLKLGSGGIREIEFFTQALQLLNGGYESRIRDRNTIRALDLLARHGFVPRREQRDLSRAYRFLRDVEHKIQMFQQAHSHQIPEDEEEEESLARRLNYRKINHTTERELFWRDYLEHTSLVRKTFERLFYSAQKEISSHSTSAAAEIWRDLDREELVVKELRRLAFSDPLKAYHNLIAIRDGDPYSPPSQKRLKVMRALGPALMTEIVHSGSPEQALLNLAEFGHRIGARTGFLSLLAENPKTLRLLINLFANSQFLTELFLKRPELLDSLIRVDLNCLRKSRKQMLGQLMATMGETEDLEERLDRMRRYRVEEFIRIGLHDLGGELDLAEVLAQLSDLAEACLEGAFRLALQEMERNYGRLPKARFAILGMGKLGGKEIDYNSDLDLIFIYDTHEEFQSEKGQPGRLDPHEYYVKLGQRLITFLSAPTKEGLAYRLDMRLRPSGRSGPLVSSLEAFRRYHETSSQLWERQALIKARCVAGDFTLGIDTEAVAERFAYGKGLSENDVEEIHRLRMRMERELAKESISRFDIKSGRGGMIDVEFLTQMLQLAYGHRYPGLRRRATMEALQALRDHEILDADDYRLQSDGYRFLRQLDHRLRLERGQSINTLEREAEKLHGIAHAMGYGDKHEKGAGERLLQDYEQRRERIRSCYERFFKAAEKAISPE